METIASNYTHEFDADVALVRCSSEHVIADEYGTDTGFRYCPHDDRTFGGGDETVG